MENADVEFPLKMPVALLSLFTMWIYYFFIVVFIFYNFDKFVTSGRGELFFLTIAAAAIHFQYSVRSRYQRCS